ncbi:hypothetical protein DL771_012214 [Monosporascus sp. 5C6A]|nr:hypothetical protein DL771_012214 [Monosporascus sp. 5C6A]
MPPSTPTSLETTAVPTSSTPTGRGRISDGIKTVTVTEGLQTTTKFSTVTAGGGESTLTTSVRSSSAQATPTSQVTVSTVEPFLKARATGAARRQAGFFA